MSVNAYIGFMGKLKRLSCFSKFSLDVHEAAYWLSNDKKDVFIKSKLYSLGEDYKPSYNSRPCILEDHRLLIKRDKPKKKKKSNRNNKRPGENAIVANNNNRPQQQKNQGKPFGNNKIRPNENTIKPNINNEPKE